MRNAYRKKKKARYQSYTTFLGKERAMGNTVAGVWKHKTIEDKQELLEEGKGKEEKLAAEYER